MIKYVNIFLFIIMVVMNYLANAIPLNNRTTGEISAIYPNLFVPAGITFAIWGIIYVLLAGYSIWQFTPKGTALPVVVDRLFALSCILNVLWLLAWHYDKVPGSLVIMVGLLLTLIYINVKISGLQAGYVKAAFGIYLGWICIATIANVTAFLVSINWDGFGIPEEVWAIIMIGAGTLITALSLIKLTNPYIGIAVIWAFTGIIINRQSDFRIIAISALTGLLIMGYFTIMYFRKI